jgi:hypothetical protein
MLWLLPSSLESDFWLGVIISVPGESVLPHQLLPLLFRRHDHHARVFAGIQADDAVETTGHVLHDLGQRSLNVFVGAGAKDPKVGFAVDVDKENIDFTDVEEPGSWRVSTLGPCGWVFGGVDLIVSNRSFRHVGRNENDLGEIVKKKKKKKEVL